MAKINWALVCAGVDQSVLGSISLIHVFNEIAVPEFPAQHRKLVVACEIEGDSSEGFSLTVQGVAPDGHQVSRTDLKALTNAAGIAQVVVTVANTPLPEAGTYVFRVSLEDSAAADIRVRVVKADLPSVA